MEARDITRKWSGKSLTMGDIGLYLGKNVITMDPLLTNAAIKAAIDICWELYLWSTGEIGKDELDGLSDAIVHNDLGEALGYCDINMRHGGLWIVSVFLYNCAPRDWNKKEGEAAPEWLSQALNEGNGVYKP